MSLRHHPADAHLADYAAGRMRAGFDVVLGAHLERCPRCRERVSMFEAVAGELMETLPETTVSDDLLAHTLALLERDPSREPEAAPPGRSLVDRLPLGRRRNLAPGVWVQPVDVPHEAGDRVYLLRVAAGLQGLHHGHDGAEMTVVLQGSLHDGETVFEAGDFAEVDTRSEEHTSELQSH